MKKESKKAKGTKNNVIQKEICFEDFRQCLLTKEPIYKKQNVLRTEHHDIDIYISNKTKKLYALMTISDLY
jgi:hypothetical protein